jgi:hypothetical protein
MFNLEGVSYKPLPEDIDPTMQSRVDVILSGKWSIEDVLEMQVDELTTAAAVGSGPDRPLGVSRDNRFEKLCKAYEEYLSKTKKESSSSVVREFLEGTAPGLDEKTVKDFTEMVLKYPQIR